MQRTTVPVFHSGSILSVAVLIVIGTGTLYVWAFWGRLADQSLLGPDSYMRVLRVLDLLQNGNWYDPHFARTNAPYGETLAWGRPLDAILYAISKPISLFVDNKSAAYYAGLSLGPLLALLMIPIWSWGTRPFLGNGSFLMIFVLYGLTLTFAFNLVAGRADHHGIIALLFLFQLAAALRLATETGAEKTALLLGLAEGVALWVSVEALLNLLVFGLVFAISFLRERKNATKHIALFTASLLIMLTIALPLERPPDNLLSVEFGRLSIVHWTLAASAAAIWAALYTALRTFPSTADGFVHRMLLLGVGGAIPLLAMALLFPKFFAGPLAHFEPDVIYPFIGFITEYEPHRPTSIRGVRRFLYYTGPVLIGLAFLLYELRRVSKAHQPVCEVLLVGILVCVPLVFWAGRFALYCQVLALIPWVMMLARTMAWTKTISVMGRQIPARGFLVVAAITGPFALGNIVGALDGDTDTSRAICDRKAISNFLANSQNPAESGKILLTYIFWGPELVWRTPYNVVIAPYANTAAFRDTFAIFKAKTNSQAKKLIDERGIDLVLICPKERENRLYRIGDAGSLFSRIESGQHPGWLSPVRLPENLSENFRLFRVTDGR